MASAEQIKPETLKEWLAADQAFLIDVREPDEYRYEHIEGAVNIPLSTIDGSVAFEKTGKKTVIQCASGNRSMQACSKIASTSALYNLSGGLSAWKTAGFPIAKEKTAILPLQRQVQITVGAGVLGSVILGAFLHPAFLLIAGFMGAGLLNAGLTGWCGMALLLAKMPWNKG